MLCVFCLRDTASLVATAHVVKPAVHAPCQHCEYQAGCRDCQAAMLPCPAPHTMHCLMLCSAVLALSVGSYTSAICRDQAGRLLVLKHKHMVSTSRSAMLRPLRHQRPLQWRMLPRFDLQLRHQLRSDRPDDGLLCVPSPITAPCIGAAPAHVPYSEGNPTLPMLGYRAFSNLLPCSRLFPSSNTDQQHI